MENLVEVKNIKKKYGSKEAVKGISFNIKEKAEKIKNCYENILKKYLL